MDKEELEEFLAKTTREDMHVVACKILGYVYFCDREGRPFDREKVSAELLEIPKSYHELVVFELETEKYLRNEQTQPASRFGKKLPASLTPHATLAGVFYLKYEKSAQDAIEKIRRTSPAFAPYFDGI